MYRNPLATRTVLCLSLVLLCSCDPASPPDIATTAESPATIATGTPASTTPPQAPTAAPVTWLLPGDFSADTTLADLQNRFGAGNVEVQGFGFDRPLVQNGSHADHQENRRVAIVVPAH